MFLVMSSSIHIITSWLGLLASYSWQLAGSCFEGLSFMEELATSGDSLIFFTGPPGTSL